jgi:hypothetical protein
VKKYGQLYKNFEINKAARRLARINSGFECVLAEMMVPQQFAIEE